MIALFVLVSVGLLVWVVLVFLDQEGRATKGIKNGNDQIEEGAQKQCVQDKMREKRAVSSLEGEDNASFSVFSNTLENTENEGAINTEAADYALFSKEQMRQIREEVKRNFETDSGAPLESAPAMTFKEIIKSSTEQSYSMLKTISEIEQERTLLKNELDIRQLNKQEAFKQLADLPENRDLHRTDKAIYEALLVKNKDMKERLYELERENLYLKEALENRESSVDHTEKKCSADPEQSETPHLKQ